MSRRPTSDLADFLSGLRDRCVSLWPDAETETLHIWPASRLTTAELEILRANKATVIAFLRSRGTELLPPDEVCRLWRRRYCKAQREAGHDQPR